MAVLKNMLIKSSVNYIARRNGTYRRACNARAHSPMRVVMTRLIPSADFGSSDGLLRVLSSQIGLGILMAVILVKMVILVYLYTKVNFVTLINSSTYFNNFAWFISETKYAASFDDKILSSCLL
jgi:hypothetical protein